MTDPRRPVRAASAMVVVATANPGKLAEMRALLNGAAEIRSAGEMGARLPEETGTTFAENAVLKAVAVARQTGQIAVADDSGLVVDALGGAPGVYSARYAGEAATDAENRRKLLHALRDVPIGRRSARFVSAVAIAFDEDDVVVVEGQCEGCIAATERGSGGFGYDPVFELLDGRTMAEITADEKNQISHRARAMEQAVPLLRRRLAREADVHQPSTATEDDG